MAGEQQESGAKATRERPAGAAQESFDHHDHGAIVHGHQHVHITHCVVDGDYSRVEHRTAVHLHEHNHSETEHSHVPHPESAGLDHDHEAHIHDHAHPTQS